MDYKHLCDLKKCAMMRAIELSKEGGNDHIRDLARAMTQNSHKALKA